MRVDDQALVQLITEEVLRYLASSNGQRAPEGDTVQTGIPIGVSVRHLHLCRADLDALFGKGYELKPLRELYQPGQFAAQETVTLVGPKGAITGVRILFPLRKKTQVEVARTDAIHLGVMPPVLLSVHDGVGAPITIVGPQGSLYLPDALIRAKRHIHMSPRDAEQWGVRDREHVTVEVEGDQGALLKDVIIRVSPEYRAEMHIDTDEGNAMDLCCGQRAWIVAKD
ncbi:MAG: phosphate propanoyltransferase [Abditibacteriales bacterium]|nr:phosphate propanoyltransferase [Abditibacteriales bacterium]